MIQVWLAGVESVLPAASVARTWKVWLPSASAGEIVSGLEQVVQPPPSIRHSNVDPGSLELKEKLGVVSLEGSAGVELRVVLGAVRSTIQVWLAGVERVLPAWSVARTSKVWLPSASAGEIVSGLEQLVQPPPSIRHSNVDPDSLELNVKVGVVSLEGLPGLESIVVSGGPVSTIQLWLAGEASVLPAWSVARTSKVWLPSPRAGEIVSGDEQPVQLPPSTRHSKVEPLSEELKVKTGVVLPEGLAGLESMVVFGAVRSTVQVWLAGEASVLPAASVARTSNVWLPSASAGEIVYGLLQADQLPPSTRHWKVEPDSEELKASVGVLSLEGLDGLESMVVSGGGLST